MKEHERPSFEIYKSTVLHRLKSYGDLGFIRKVLIDDDITVFYERKWYAECLYLLALVDYLSEMHGVALCDKYDELRCRRLTSLVYPAEVALGYDEKEIEENKKECLAKAIPAFLRYNIVETDIRSAV